MYILSAIVSKQGLCASHAHNGDFIVAHCPPTLTSYQDNIQYYIDNFMRRKVLK